MFLELAQGFGLVIPDPCVSWVGSGHETSHVYGPNPDTVTQQYTQASETLLAESANLPLVYTLIPVAV